MSMKDGFLLINHAKTKRVKTKTIALHIMNKKQEKKKVKMFKNLVTVTEVL